jgi:hypothetical protein
LPCLICAVSKMAIRVIPMAISLTKQIRCDKRRKLVHYFAFVCR